MLSFYKKYYKTVLDIALLIGTVLIIMWLFSYLYRIAAPIFFALGIFAIIEPFAKFLHKKGVKKSIATALSILVLLTVVLGILFGSGIVLTTQIVSLSDQISDYVLVVQHEVIQFSQYVIEQFGALPDDWNERIVNFSANAAEIAGSFAVWFLTGLYGMITSVSNFVVNSVIGLILAYFLSVEIDLWKRVAKEKTPNTFKKAFNFLREHVLKGIGRYLKAQAKLMSITFIIIFVALLLLRVNNAFAIALLAALFDLLPLLGVSTIFLPWIVTLFIMGNVSLAIWLSALLLVVISFRQIFEPKIVGDSLGVSAFTMLSLMVISLALFGIMGLILAPVLTILLKELYVQGYLKSWIRAPEDYDDDDDKQAIEPK